MNNPKVSIITICFNAEKTIGQTIESVLNQQYNNIEYIIIDGASKDNTLSVIEPFRLRISKVISEPDKGLYDAFNKGLRLATGDIIGILNSDDFYPNSMVIQKVVNIFNNNAGAEAVSTSVQIFKNNQFIQPFRTYKAKNFKLWQFRFGMQPPHPGFFITKEALSKVGYYNDQYRISGDFDWLLRAILLNKVKTIYDNFITVYMRDGGLSASGFSSKKRMNQENLKSLRSNGIYSNQLLIYSKYLFKIFQLNLFPTSKKKAV
ncbi:MAG: glycosyltransferase family 2 protein [bacterium]|nr:glycosyltransferase family 2 protein [bacterium]